MLKHTAASGPLALFFATFRRCNGEVRVNRLLPASASPLRDVVRNQSSEHIKLFLVHSHLRLKDIRSLLERLIDALLRATEHDCIIRQCSVRRDNRRRCNRAVLSSVSKSPTHQRCQRCI
jgi:hypothetical protein